MKNRLITLALLIALLTAPMAAANRIISITDLNHAAALAQPGDTLIIRNGTYSDAEIRIKGKGTSTHPIVIKAEDAGKVIISGKSNLRLAGEYIEVNGLFFKEGYSHSGPVIEYAMGDDLANHCRITQCAISYYNPSSRSTGYFWVLLHGRHNRFDHNSLEGKLNIEMVLVVDLGDERSQENYHRIDHNYFGARPTFGSNGGETIRVGNSYTQFYPSRTEITDNLFEHCNGEVEVVSIKSSNNIIRHNLFLECAGVLALRHGNNNLVEGNAFIGNDKPFTGGIRVVNEGHTIRGNLFYQLTGDRFFSALGLMNAVPNSLPNRYHHVRNITIENNQFINCPNLLFGVGKDDERTQAPSDITFRNNTIFSEYSSAPLQVVDPSCNVHFEGNRMNSPYSKKHEGFTPDKKLNNLIDLSLYPQRSEVGTSWYTIIGQRQPPIKTNRTAVAAGQNTLIRAVELALPGDTLVLSSGSEYTINQSIIINKTIAIINSDASRGRAIIRYNGKRSVPFITLADGADLLARGLYFNGYTTLGFGSATYGIITDRTMISPYWLTVVDCEFSHFESGNTGAIRGGKGTFSSLITIANCYFHDMVGDAIRFADEKDDRGLYSIENLTVSSSVFSRMLGTAIEVYRGGNDESTSGPSVKIDQCVFYDVNNREQGSAVKLWGTQQALVTNCIFDNSGKGGASIRFNETRWDKIEVSANTLWNSGRISSFWGNVEKGKNARTKPQFIDPAKGDFRLKGKF